MKKILDVPWIGPTKVCEKCIDFSPTVCDIPLYSGNQVIAREITIHCANEALCSRLINGVIKRIETDDKS